MQFKKMVVKIVKVEIERGKRRRIEEREEREE